MLKEKRNHFQLEEKRAKTFFSKAYWMEAKTPTKKRKQSSFHTK